MPIFETNSILEMPASYKGGLVHIFYILLSIRAINPMQQPEGISCLMSFRSFLILTVKAVSNGALLGVNGF